jgi:mRNA-degrading endonuclease RelE of RelBE toxin-antitoxin system
MIDFPWAGVVETAEFRHQVSDVLSEAELDALIQFLARNPRTGVVVPGAGGVRKLRWKSKGKGKRGGARVIYYYKSEKIPLYLLSVYGKNRKEDLSALEKLAFRAFTAHL